MPWHTEQERLRWWESVCRFGSELMLTAWHAVHVVMVDVFHDGLVAVPPEVPPLRLMTAPWHQVDEQLPAVVPARGVQVPFRRLALAAPVKPTWFVPSE